MVCHGEGCSGHRSRSSRPWFVHVLTRLVLTCYVHVYSLCRSSLLGCMFAVLSPNSFLRFPSHLDVVSTERGIQRTNSMKALGESKQNQLKVGIVGSRRPAIKTDNLAKALTSRRFKRTTTFFTSNKASFRDMEETKSVPRPLAFLLAMCVVRALTLTGMHVSVLCCVGVGIHLIGTFSAGVYMF